MKLVFGLGNPGENYANTRHNVGYRAINTLAESYKIDNPTYELNALIAEGNISEEKVYLVQPCSYMNNSGRVVKNVIEYYQSRPEDIIIIYDDLDLPVGQLRIQIKGSSGGHNGITSVINNLGTQKFPRIRIGIGHPPEKVDIIDYVLGYFSNEDDQLIKEALEKIEAVLKTICSKGYDEAMNNFN